MKNWFKKCSGVGVVVGRFQVDQLHKGHLHLLRFAHSRHKHLLVVLGVAKSFPTPRNPLSHKIREAMIKKVFPKAVVAPLTDHRSDEIWSENLDKLIESFFLGSEATLYGSRDSFLKYYRGRFARFEVPPVGEWNGTECRKSDVEVSVSRLFRRGVIHSHLTRKPIVYPTVDVAVVDSKNKRVLMAGKESDGGKLRFVGGFVDATDASFEASARRELGEEAPGIETADWQCLGSSCIDDWRYRGSGDTILTTFFTASYVSGSPQPADDICRLEWVAMDQVEKVVVEEHKPLAKMFLERRKP